MRSRLTILFRACAIVAVVLPMISACGCAYARLERALVNRAPVKSGEVSGAKITRVAKEVEEQITPRVKMALKKGDILETDDVTHLVIFFPGSKTQVILYPNTRVRVSSVVLEVGTILISVFVERREKLEVETRYARMKTRGTAYKLVAPVEPELVLTVLNGEVEVFSKTGPGTTRVRAFERVKLVESDIGRVEPLSETERRELVAEFNDLGHLTGSKTRVVPQCVGLPLDEGKRRVADAGLRARVDERLTESIDEVGQVLAQTPGAGAFQDAKTQMRLTVGVRGVRVPQVGGLPLREAENVAGQSQLRLNVRGKEITGTCAPDTVLRQQPVANSLVRVDSIVTVVIEDKSVAVPNLIGLHVNQAGQTLRNNQLQMRVGRDEITGRYPAQSVISQTPAAGKLVKLNSSVTVVLEAESVRVPNLVGMDLGAAQRQFQSQLRIVQRGTQITGAHRFGTILNQYTNAEQLVRPGSEIGVIVEGRSVVVPNVVGVNVRHAQDNLRGAGLHNVHIESFLVRDRRAAGLIRGQQPAGGTRVAPDTRVVLQVAQLGRAVPDLVGRTALKAQEIGQQHGFNVVLESAGAMDNLHKVVRQTPLAGQLVNPATTRIQITVEEIVIR